LRAEFEAQRQACVHAEQSAAVLKAQKEILEAQLAELKEATLRQIQIRGDGSGKCLRSNA
jgi:BMFP domain-containing protein YqiC